MRSCSEDHELLPGADELRYLALGVRIASTYWLSVGDRAAGGVVLGAVDRLVALLLGRGFVGRGLRADDRGVPRP